VRSKTNLRKRGRILVNMLNMFEDLDARFEDLDDEDLIDEDDSMDLFSIQEELDRCRASLQRVYDRGWRQLDGIDEGL
jgi:hypothetical protein